MDASDPRNQAVPEGQGTSEQRVAMLTAMGTLLGTFGLAALVLVALILGKIDTEATLILLGFLLLPGAPSAAYVARGYSADRTALKTEVAKGAAAVAVAEAKAEEPRPPASGPPLGPRP